MTNLIKHYLLHNLEEVLAKSLMNCHCIGLHSIMLSDVPGRRIRLFIADDNHEMWKNHFTEDELMSVGFHAHHCDITLDVICGEITNWVIAEIPIEDTKKLQHIKSRLDPGILNAYRYTSAITTGEMGIKDVGLSGYFECKKYTSHVHYGAAFMKANEIHTVYVEAGKVAAWMVYEGKEDPDYLPYIYSISKPEVLPSGYLYYQPMSYSMLINLLRKIGYYSD